MSFDLSRTNTTAQASEQGHTFEPVFPGGQPIGAQITVRGPRSQAVRDYASARYAKATAREVQAKRTGRPVEAMGLDDADEALTDLAVVYTMGWSGVVNAGQPVPFTADAARELYTAHPWMREQVIAEAQDLGNFIKPCLLTSTPTPLPSLS